MVSSKISILIANYNNGHFFKDCYDSLISQTEKNWEAIVIDDCSTDNSMEMIKSLINNDKRFRFYQNKKNIGYQKTIVRGITLSTSDIFGRLDPDDALKENAIEESIKTHKENPEIGLAYSNFFFCDENMNEIGKHTCKQVNDKNIFLKGEISHFATFKKEIYFKTTGIDVTNKRAEDQDIYMKMCETAPVKYINKDLYKYRLHNNGASTNTNFEKAIFWHWVAFIKAAERRDINIENQFVETFINRIEYEKEKNKLNLLKNSRLLKLLYKLGIFKAYKYL
jgi:glycosyltransferase involved in cell wall biosynthesis